MRAERERIRRQLRSEAQREAEAPRGAADAEAIRIYAEAYGRDEEFYRFLRTLQSYDAFIDEGTTLILPADSELLQFLNPQSIAGSGAGESTSSATGAAAPELVINP